MKLKAFSSLVVLFSLIFIQPASAKDFEAWLAKFKQDAARKGISKHVVDQAMQGVKPIPVSYTHLTLPTTPYV